MVVKGAQQRCEFREFSISLLILLTSFRLFFFSFLKTSSSSDFDAAGDVDTALNRHRWADDEDKEKRGWRVWWTSERNTERGGQNDKEWIDNKSSARWVKEDEQRLNRY